MGTCSRVLPHLSLAGTTTNLVSMNKELLEEFARIYNCKTACVEKDGFTVCMIEDKTITVGDGVGSFNAFDTKTPTAWTEAEINRVADQAIAEYKSFMP